MTWQEFSDFYPAPWRSVMRAMPVVLDAEESEVLTTSDIAFAERICLWRNAEAGICRSADVQQVAAADLLASCKEMVNLIESLGLKATAGDGSIIGRMLAAIAASETK